jgi:hypothetical protein
MRKFILAAAITLISASAASAYTVNGMYFTQVSCKYQYNSDFATGGYVGSYRGNSGEIYSWFFPSPQYSWCPY